MRHAFCRPCNTWTPMIKCKKTMLPDRSIEIKGLCGIDGKTRLKKTRQADQELYVSEGLREGRDFVLPPEPDPEPKQSEPIKTPLGRYRDPESGRYVRWPL